MTPTFSYDKPLPPDDRFGVLSCMKTRRQHVRLFANATRRSERKQRRSPVCPRKTRSKVPSPDKFLSEDHLEKYRLIVRGAADYTEQVVASARVDDPYSLDLYAGITGLVGNETLETNADQADPLDVDMPGVARLRMPSYSSGLLQRGSRPVESPSD